MTIFNSLIKKTFTLDRIIILTLFFILPLFHVNAIVMCYTASMLLIVSIINFIFKQYRHQ